MRSLAIRGGCTYGDFQAAFVATWPKLRAYLFVDDHEYWKGSGGELAAGDLVGRAGQDVTLRGDAVAPTAEDAVRKTYRLNFEIRRADGGFVGAVEPLDDCGGE